MASLLWASATRRFASATLRERSSMLGITGPGVGEGLAALAGGVATAAGFEWTPGMLFFIAATLAAISARF